jgi:hypothetical protein
VKRNSTAAQLACGQRQRRAVLGRVGGERDVLRRADRSHRHAAAHLQAVRPGPDPRERRGAAEQHRCANATVLDRGRFDQAIVERLAADLDAHDPA